MGEQAYSERVCPRSLKSPVVNEERTKTVGDFHHLGVSSLSFFTALMLMTR